VNLWKLMNRKEDPDIYQEKDGHLVRTLKVRDFLALGVGPSFQPRSLHYLEKLQHCTQDPL